MNMNAIEKALKLFAISNQLAENDLDRIEREFTIDLGRAHTATLEKDVTYYPQIERAIRVEAESMSQHYEIFYSLEKTIRSLVADTLQTAAGDAWWESGRIPSKIKADAEARLQKEIDSAITVRSSDPLDFTTFGELGEIIKGNWDLFGSLFTSPKAVERVMANLNTLRGPIAHCGTLAQDEVLRLRLSVSDWFRLME
jgi:hypothetical protein